jgi:hypothetical protein
MSDEEREDLINKLAFRIVDDMDTGALIHWAEEQMKDDLIDYLDSELEKLKEDYSIT